MSHWSPSVAPIWHCHMPQETKTVKAYSVKISTKLCTTIIWIQQPNWPYNCICCVHTKLFWNINSNFLLHFNTTFFKTHSMQWCNENIIHNYLNFNLTIAIFLCQNCTILIGCQNFPDLNYGFCGKLHLNYQSAWYAYLFNIYTQR